MRATLEQLQAMDEKRIEHLWVNGKFPFDSAKGCDSCLTQHANTAYRMCHEDEHRVFSSALPPLSKGWQIPYIMQYLPELYAARLFFDHLYEPAATPEPITEQPAEKVKETVCEND